MYIMEQLSYHIHIMEQLSYHIYDKFRHIIQTHQNIIINDIKYNILMIEFKITKGYEFICKKRDGMPYVLTLFDVNKEKEILLVFMMSKMNKHGRIILFDVELSLILSEKEISHIKKYWKLKNKAIDANNYNYIKYLDMEYNYFLEKNGLNLKNNEYPQNLYDFLHLGFF